jgi:hypothetical protein
MELGFENGTPIHEVKTQSTSIPKSPPPLSNQSKKDSLKKMPREIHPQRIDI